MCHSDLTSVHCILQCELECILQSILLCILQCAVLSALICTVQQQRDGECGAEEAPGSLGRVDLQCVLECSVWSASMCSVECSDVQYSVNGCAVFCAEWRV